MNKAQIVVIELCIAFVGLGLYSFLSLHQVMSAIFFAVLALAFAVLFDGLREMK